MLGYRYWLVPMALIMVTCKKEESKDDGKIEKSVSVSDAVATLPYTPTRPTGGDVIGKSRDIDPKADALLQAENSSKPILWGQEIGGISLGMTEDKVNQILSRKVQSGQNTDLYAEGVQVVWSNSEPRQAVTIVARAGYGGAAEIGGELGSIRVGTSVESFFVADPFGDSLMKSIGSAVEKKPASYNCRTSLTCRFAQFSQLLFYDFAEGGIAIDGNLQINLIYLASNEGLFSPRVEANSIFGSTIAGQSMAITQTDFEKAVGAPQGASPDGLLLYDDFNLFAVWSPNGLPLLMGVQGDYLGKIDFGVDLEMGKSQYEMGDSFASVGFSDEEKEQKISDLGLDPDSENIKSELLINYLFHQMRIRDAEPGSDVVLSNCLKESIEGDALEPSPAKCRIVTNANLIRLDFENGSIGLTNDDELQLALVFLISEANVDSPN